RLTATETSTVVEIVWTNRLPLVVGESDCRGTVAASFRPVTLPALHLIEELPAVKDTIDVLRRLRGNRDGCASFLRLPFWREGLDVGDEIYPGLRSERPPSRHVSIHDTSGYRVVEVLVGGQ